MWYVKKIPKKKFQKEKSNISRKIETIAMKANVFTKMTWLNKNRKLNENKKPVSLLAIPDIETKMTTCFLHLYTSQR